MQKFENWAELLSNFLFECQNKKFVRGEFDCALFACDAFKAQTGIDPGEAFRGKYTTKVGAAKELKKNGGTLRQVAVKKFKSLGLKTIDVVFAQRGDVAYAKVSSDTVLAIVDMSGRFLTLSPLQLGPVVIDKKFVKLVWRTS